MKRKIFYLIMSIFAINLFSQEIIQFEELEKHFKKDKIFQEILNKDIDFGTPKSRDITTGYDMVIITNQYLENAFEDFAEIKTREGIRTFVVTTQTTGSDSLCPKRRKL